MLLAKVVLFWIVVGLVLIVSLIAWEMWGKPGDRRAAADGAFVAVVVGMGGTAVIVSDHVVRSSSRRRSGSDRTGGFPVRLVDKDGTDSGQPPAAE